jgi:peptidoglycan hydrolase CwlO-like protein
MGLSERDFHKISQILDKKLEPIFNKLDKIEIRLTKIEYRVEALEKDVAILKKEVKDIKELLSYDDMVKNLRIVTKGTKVSS